MEGLASEAVAKALREGREALRDATQRSSAERRALAEDIDGQEEQLASLAHELSGGDVRQLG